MISLTAYWTKIRPFALLFNKLATLRTDAVKWTGVGSVRWEGETQVFSASSARFPMPLLLVGRSSRSTPCKAERLAGVIEPVTLDCVVATRI